MSVASLRVPTVRPSGSESALEHVRDDPAYQAFWLLRIGFTLAPILFGADKFANVLVNWEKYLAPWIRDASPLSATHTMYVVGVIEIVAGLAVAIKPRYAAYVVAAWLGGIIVNLLSYSGYYDVALRDFGLLLAALTLARLASVYDPPWFGKRSTRRSARNRDRADGSPRSRPEPLGDGARQAPPACSV